MRELWAGYGATIPYLCTPVLPYLTCAHLCYRTLPLHTLWRSQAHLRELWTDYGALEEIWFDGGYDAALKPSIAALLAELQPHAVVFGGVGLTPRALGSVCTPKHQHQDILGLYIERIQSIRHSVELNFQPRACFNPFALWLRILAGCCAQNTCRISPLIYCVCSPLSLFSLSLSLSLCV